MTRPINITIFNEFIHEKSNPVVTDIYPEGIHTTLADGLAKNLGKNAKITTATLDQPSHGLTPETLGQTDVLLWWAHLAHDQVDDQMVNHVHQRILAGMGLLVLHSAHASKIFQKLMGTNCMLKYREAAEVERLWIVNPTHPIVKNIDTDCIQLPQTEMYGEFFDIPKPDDLILISSFEGGEVFRSGCTFQRGHGKIFYLRPGHETYPIYHHPQIQTLIANAVQWLAPDPATPTYHPHARHTPGSVPAE